MSRDNKGRIPEHKNRKEKAEQMRREFTANVSHELKTPLTAISGYAELIEHHMAREEDVGRFGGEIHRSAVRLLRMIDDIIRLSETGRDGDRVAGTGARAAL